VPKVVASARYSRKNLAGGEQEMIMANEELLMTLKNGKNNGD
jgi:hypothetical protein